MAPKPRPSPRDVPDSLPRDERGSGVAPDDPRPGERSRPQPPDSPPADDQEVERERP